MWSSSRRSASRLRGSRARFDLEGKRLIAEHRLDDDVAGFPGVERMLCDQVAAFGDDLVGILHDLELLEAIRSVQPHALTDHFENVDDPERPVALVGAQLAMFGVIDGNQRIDASLACRL